MTKNMYEIKIVSLVDKCFKPWKLIFFFDVYYSIFNEIESEFKFLNQELFDNFN